MKKILNITLVIISMLATSISYSQSNNGQLNLNKGMAIEGYDAVAYFTQNKAVKGKKEFAVAAEGATYYFSSNENKELFKKDYKKYLPQYGGWCAYAMGATNEKVEIDPETFKIISGKLYLFYHTWVNNTLTKWNKDEANLKVKADANWIKFLQTKN